MKQLSSVFLVLVCTLAFSNISFGKAQEANTKIAKSKPFEILYSETIPQIGLQRS